MERTTLIVLVAALIALLGLGTASASDSNDYKVLVVVWANSTRVYPSDLGEPLIALTKTSCGEAVAIVYGYRSGEPLLCNSLRVVQ